RRDGRCRRFGTLPNRRQATDRLRLLRAVERFRGVTRRRSVAARLVCYLARRAARDLRTRRCAVLLTDQITTKRAALPNGPRDVATPAAGVIPSFSIFESSVVRLSPRRTAAPRGPETIPFVSRSTSPMCSRAAPSSVWAGAAGGRAAFPGASSDGGSRLPPCDRITAR